MTKKTTKQTTPRTNAETIAEMKSTIHAEGWLPFEAQVKIGRTIRVYAFFAPHAAAARMDALRMATVARVGCQPQITILPL